MKKFLLSALALVPFMGFAAAYTTAGNGTTYNVAALAAIEGSNVTVESEGVYVVSDAVEIAAGDTFNLESGITVKMADLAEIVVKGAAQLKCTEVSTITVTDADARPYGIKIDPEVACDPVYVENVKFDGAGLKFFFADDQAGKGYITNCEFTNCPKRYTYALQLGTSKCEFEVKDCRFISNVVPAIGSAANYFCGLLIEDCYFYDNNTQNNNQPQCNLTVGEYLDVVIKNNVFEGTQRNMVGGLAVSNMLGFPGTHKVIIEGNTFTGHRYGLTTTSMMDVVIKNNIIKDNKYETNPNNGGSGISIYDPYNYQIAHIEGNVIEDNLWGITIISSAVMENRYGVYNLGKTADPNAEDYNPGNNVFKNNGNGGVLYDLYNNSPFTVYAQGNTWGVDEQTAEKIETVITHKADNESLGEVIYMPETNGINSIDADNAPVEYFNLMGQKVLKPAEGVFIKKQGKNTSKVIL